MTAQYLFCEAFSRDSAPSTLLNRTKYKFSSILFVFHLAKYAADADDANHVFLFKFVKIKEENVFGKGRKQISTFICQKINVVHNREKNCFN